MHTSLTTRLQDYTNHKGLALCGHSTLDVTARWWVPVNIHGTPTPQRREAVGSQKLHKRLKAANKTQTLTLEQEGTYETRPTQLQHTRHNGPILGHERAGFNLLCIREACNCFESLELDQQMSCFRWRSIHLQF